jgi:hypothetical protein
MKTRKIFLLILLFVGLMSCKRDFDFENLDPEKPTEKVLVEITSTEGGDVNPSGVVNLVKGSDLLLSMIPESGFVTDSIIIDSLSFPLVGNKYNITNIAKDDTIFVKVFFTKVPTILVEVICSEGGSANLSGITEVAKGSNFSLNLVPDLWHKIDYVLVDGVNFPLTTNTLNLLGVNENLKIEVFFKKDLSFPWILNGKTLDLDSLVLLNSDGVTWNRYKIMGDSTQIQVALEFKFDTVLVYYDGVLKAKPVYKITNTLPQMFQQEGGPESEILLLTESRLILGITDGITNKLTGWDNYKVRPKK